MTHSTDRDALIKRGRDFMQARADLVADNDCLPIMIMACIAAGFITRHDIVRTVPKYVGHGYAHVASTLDRYTGSDPFQDYWYRDEEKKFHLHAPDRAEMPVAA